MELKPGYKKTEIGIFPENWSVCKIESIISDISMGPFGSDIKVSNFVSVGIPVLSGENVKSVALVDSFSNFVTATKAKSLKKAVARRGDIVVTHRGTLGQISYIPENSIFDRYVVSQSQFRVRFNDGIADPCWIVLYFHSNQGAKNLLEGKGHTGVPAIAQPTKTFRQLSIPLPPIAEQRATATAVSDVDTLLTSLDKLIAKKRAVKAAATQQLLTGKKRLPGFSGEWKVKRLGELGRFLKGSGVTRDDSQSGPFACVRYGEIYTLHHNYIRNFNSWISGEVASSATRLERGDLLFAGSGETKEEIGKCVAFVDERVAYAGGDIVILRPRGVDSLFLGYALNTTEVNRQKASFGQGDAVVHISAAALSRVVLTMPCIEEQTAISKVLTDMDSEIAALEARREKTKAIKQGMMQELLTGRTRLI